MKISVLSAVLTTVLVAHASAFAIPDVAASGGDILAVRSYPPAHAKRASVEPTPAKNQKVVKKPAAGAAAPAAPAAGSGSGSGSRSTSPIRGATSSETKADPPVKTTPRLLDKSVKWHCADISTGAASSSGGGKKLRRRGRGDTKTTGGSGKKGKNGKGDPDSEPEPAPAPPPKEKKEKKKKELVQPNEYTFTGAEINRVLRVAKATRSPNGSKYPSTLKNEGPMFTPPVGTVDKMWEYPLMTGSTDWKEGRNTRKFRMAYTQIGSEIVFVGVTQHPPKAADGTEDTKNVRPCKQIT